MNKPPMKRLIATIVMASYLAACTSWQVQDAPAPQAAKQLRVTLTDGRRALLRDPQLVGDSLVGFAVLNPDKPFERTRLAFRAVEVQQIEGRRMDAGKTMLAAFGVGVVVLLYLKLRNFQTTDPNH